MLQQTFLNTLTNHNLQESIHSWNTESRKENPYISEPIYFNTSVFVFFIIIASQNKDETTAIVGGAVGGGLAVLVACVAVLVWRKRNKRYAIHSINYNKQT